MKKYVNTILGFFCIYMFSNCSNPQNQNQTVNQEIKSLEEKPIKHSDSSLLNLKQQCLELMNKFDSSLQKVFIVNEKNKALKIRPYDVAMIIKIRAEEMYNLIRDIKIELIKAVENISYEQAKNKNIKEIHNKNNWRIPTYILIGTNPDKPEGRAVELKKKVNHFLEDAFKLLPADTINDVQFDINTKNINGKSWEHHYFYKVPLSDVYITLSALELEIRKIEYSIIHIWYLKAVNKK